MTYYQFIHAVEVKVKEGIANNIKVNIHAVLKNNGTIRQGLTLKENGINISPTIYLEEYYQRLLNGDTVEEIADDILRLYGAVRFDHSMDADFMKDYKKIKGHIVYRLINKEANDKLLEEVPHKDYLDLAIVYYLMLDISSYGMASMLIRNEHVKLWGVTEQEIHINACKNTSTLLPDEFQTMSSLIESLTGKKEPKLPKDILYVLSNHIRSFGAAAILYERRLENIGDYLGDNYYVIPSSVHEVIIIPESEISLETQLKELVKEVNDTQVEDEEVLSYSVYYYDRAMRKLLIES